MTDASGLVFDRVADAYDRVRPDYPPSLVDEACSIGGLAGGSHVVEVGCGTGKLTGALVERGLRVEAVDPGPRLVEIARRRLRESVVRFHVGRFEDVELPRAVFDAVFSATAFHRIDSAVGWSKVARLLRPGGVLALLAHVGDSSELRPAFLTAWREVLPEAAAWVSRERERLWEGAAAPRDNVSEVWSWLVKRELTRPEAAQLFGDVQLAKIRSSTTRRSQRCWRTIRRSRGTFAWRRSAERSSKRVSRRWSRTRAARYRATTFAVLVTVRVTSE